MDKPWIELDYDTGRTRYTYWGNPEETLLRHDWMSDADWKQKKVEFFDRHKVVLVQTRKGKSVDTMRDKAI